MKRFPVVIFNYRIVFRDPDDGSTLWEHIPTGLRRWVDDWMYGHHGIERAFGPVLELVS